MVSKIADHTIYKFITPICAIGIFKGAKGDSMAICQNGTDFSSVQFFLRMVVFSVRELKYAIEFSREQRELP